MLTSLFACYNEIPTTTYATLNNSIVVEEIDVQFWVLPIKESNSKYRYICKRMTWYSTKTAFSTQNHIETISWLHTFSFIKSLVITGTYNEWLMNVLIGQVFGPLKGIILNL